MNLPIVSKNENSQENLLQNEVMNLTTTETETQTQTQTEARKTNNNQNSFFGEEKIYSNKIIDKIRSYSDWNSLIDGLVKVLQEALKVNRVLIYRFDSNISGTGIAESMESDWMPTKNESFACNLFGKKQANEYAKHDYVVLGEGTGVEPSPYQQKLLAHFQVKSSLALPIWIRSYGRSPKNQVLNKVWGLLVVQQCDGPRTWQIEEIQLLERVSVELSLALLPSQPLLLLEKDRDINTTIYQNMQQLMKKMLTVIRQTLKADRVLVYGYNPDGSGKILGESFDIQYQAAGSYFDQDYFLDHNCKPYYVVNDIYTKGFARCFISALEGIKAKAYITVPIVENNDLLGVLSVYQNSNPRNWQKSEVELMVKYASKFIFPLQQTLYLRHTEFKLEWNKKIIAREQGLNKMLERIRSTNDLETVFQIATQEGRKLINVDRVAIYRFESDWSGKFIAESVTPGWAKLIDTILVVQDTYLQETQGGRYKHGECFAVDDIYTIGHQDCHLELLEQFEARAYLIAPIFTGNKKLWGLIGAYHNSGSHKWQSDEIDAVRQIGLQVGIAMEQIELIQQIQTRNQELDHLNKRENTIIEFSTELVNRLAGLAQGGDSTPMLEFATNELRQVLDVSRVGVYRFFPDYMGEFIVESVNPKYSKLIGTELAQVQDTYLKENKGGRYANRENLRIEDIYQTNYNECHLDLLEKMEVRAYMIAPIFKGEDLWGLLGIYQNDSPRNWTNSEEAIMNQVATQIGVTLQLTEYLNQVKEQEAQLTQAAEQERSKREQLQQGALRVLQALEPSFQGDLTIRAPLSEDEIGTIADGYNTTIQSLRELVRQVQMSAIRVSDTSESNTISVTELSSVSQKQVNQLKEALNELEVMVLLTKEVTNNAQKVEQAVQEANQKVQSGDSLMRKTVESILEIRDTVSETAKKVKKLGEASQKISKVVNLIDNFATQTNLLSLNAAIEATRAGEYGKGFAVVADEVRVLAYQSANATTEIERLIEQIQGEVSEVTEVMEIGIAQVVKGSNLVDETRQSLSEIVTVTSNISELVEEITHATSTQDQQSQIVTQAMIDVSTLANETLENSALISQSFQELLDTSMELQTSVSKFKVD